MIVLIYRLIMLNAEATKILVYNKKDSKQNVFELQNIHKRSEYSCNLITINNKIYLLLFGGYYNDLRANKVRKHYVNDILLIDLN